MNEPSAAGRIENQPFPEYSWSSVCCLMIAPSEESFSSQNRLSPSVAKDAE